MLLLAGDVHCNYSAAAELTAVDHADTAIHQLTMSPFRNNIPLVGKLANRILNRKGPTGRRAPHGPLGQGRRRRP